MNFDMEMSVKIIVGICSVIGLWKVFTDVSRGKKSDLREDYDFSYRFFKEYEGNKDMPPILIEKGLRAVSGTVMLSVEEILYLLTLKHPSRSMKIYERCQGYLVFDEKQKKILFGKRYRSKIYRKSMKVFSFVVYFISASAVLFPLLFMKSVPKIGNVFTILLSVGILIYLAWSSVSREARIDLSEEFMKELSAAEKEDDRCLQIKK